MAELLASVEDLEVRLGRTFTSTETDRAEALLADASAAVQAYTGQQFTVGTSTVRLQVRNGTVRPPQSPISTITGIANIEGAALDHVWYAGPTVAVTGSIDGSWVDVTYDHGYEELPADIVAVVCQVAGRAMGVPADQGGIAQESIGNYSYSVGVAAAAGSVGLLNDERAVLDRYRRIGGMARIGP